MCVCLLSGECVCDEVLRVCVCVCVKTLGLQALISDVCMGCVSSEVRQ